MTAVLGAMTSSLNIVVDDKDVLPWSHRYMQTMTRVETIYGNYTTFVILVRGRVPGQDAVAVTAVRGMSEALAAMPGIVPQNLLSVAVNKIKDIDGRSGDLAVRPFLEDVGGDEAVTARVAAVLERNPIYRDLLVSADGTMFGIVAEVRADSTGYRALSQRLEATIAPYRNNDVEIVVGGQPSFLALSEQMSDRMGWLFPLALVVIALVHFEAFRSVQAMVLPLVTGLMAVIWGLGLMSVLKIPLDPFNAVTPILILAVGAGHAVQILKRYTECYAETLAQDVPPQEAQHIAVVTSYASVMPAVFAACMAAIAGFLSLLFFDIEAIQRFGLFAAIGIACVLVIEAAFIPVVRCRLRPPDPQRARQVSAGPWERIAGVVGSMVLRRPGRVLAIALLIAAVAVAGIFRLHVLNSVKAYFPAWTEVRQTDDAINRVMAGTDVVFVLVETPDLDGVKNPQVLRALDKIQTALAQKPGVGKVVSLVDYVKRLDRAIGGDREAEGLIPESAEQASQYLLLYSLSADPLDFSSVVDTDYRTTLMTVFLKDTSSTIIRDIECTVLEIGREDMPAGTVVGIAGNAASPVAMADMIVTSKLQNIGVIAAVVFAVASLYFCSLAAGILVVLPLAFSVLVVFGAMGWAGVPLNVPTATIAALCIGIGADYAVYLLSRVREERRNGRDLDLAVSGAIASAGKAVMFVATAIAAGFLVLLLSQSFLVHVWLGSFVGLAMMTAALATLLPMMALVMLVRPRFLTVAPVVPADSASVTA
ncbi:MAG: MMPL family transporter [Rhodospirillaceae bacterium]|nr:MMPL family transporter [Rhodospirillaceae bacterium]